MTRHPFRSDRLPEDDYFAFGARKSQSLPFNFPKWETMRSLMKWHYRHAAINARGSSELKPLLECGIAYYHLEGSDESFPADS